MQSILSKRLLVAVAGALGMVCGSSVPLWAVTPVRAQSAVGQPSDAQLLEDFNYYVLTATHELAKANAAAILDRNIDPKRFVGLVEENPTMIDRFERSTRNASVIPDLADVAGRLNRLYEDGKLAIARDPGEIGRNIGLLTGNRKGKLLATDRLKVAGEYAVPQLLEILQKRGDPVLEAEAQAVLVQMGPHAVAPLGAALTGGLDAVVQESVARVLGQIPYRWSLPYLYEARAKSTSEQLSLTIDRAIEKIDRPYDAAQPVPALYRDLAEAYYAEPSSLTLFAGESHQLLWTFTPESGLQPTAIRTEVFHEARAMELCERSLRLDPSQNESVALWVASNLSREIDQPEGYENPVYGPDRRDATYYAVASGAESVQRVLARALGARDTRLARRAIQALSMSSGGAGLVRGADDRRPLVEALGYPDRRVQYEAALALGRGNPRESFEGADRVIPVLASAIRDADKRYAMVISPRLEQQQELRAGLEKDGYTVLPPAGTLGELAGAISEVPGIDLIVTNMNAPATIETVQDIRRNQRLSATPVIALMSPAGMAQQGIAIADDHLTKQLREGVSGEQLAAAANDLVDRVSGPMVSGEDARDYALASLDVLHEIAIGGGVYDVRDATVPLISSLADAEGVKRLQIADVLSYVGDRRAQIAIMDAVIDAPEGERIALLSKAVESAKRFGNLLEDRHARWIVKLARDGGPEEATLAAAMVGALNLESTQVVPLILGK